MNRILAKVYAAILGIPLAAIMFAEAIGTSGSYDYGDYDSDAEATENLCPYNACILIEGESQ